MDLSRVVRTLVGTDDEDVERAERYRAEARSAGLTPDGWNGDDSLTRCELCAAYNRDAFSICRICASRLPRLTISPEEVRESPPVRESGH